MSAPYWVLDSGALMAYAHGVEAVGEILVEVADAEATVAVPLVCLVEAYSLLDHDEHDLLRMLRRNPAVRTVVPALDLDRADDCPLIGSMARHTGRLGAGHAAYVALTNTAGVVTSRPDQIRAVLGDGWEIVEV
ncbi:hypothetical protein [Micromonospora sp. NPDC049679]|uniref:hypothetical protein n=1 Tax=Micromonospora sp. NPDC049679 TaxID=3155920 RepID=UPI0033C35BA5